MKKDPFVTLKLKQKTAEDFRKFCRILRRQQTETLQLMLDFFRDHNLSPAEDLGPNMKTLEGNVNKRINALIAIIKEIEKTQTKPVLAMLQLLFQEDTRRSKKEPLVEKPREIKNEKIKAPSKDERVEKEKIEGTQKDIKLLLKNVVVVRNSFGKPYLRLNMNMEELKLLQTKYY